VLLHLLENLQQLGVAPGIVIVPEKPQGSHAVVVDETVDGLRRTIRIRHVLGLDRATMLLEQFSGSALAPART
jgi:hypothetical protein